MAFADGGADGTWEVGGGRCGLGASCSHKTSSSAWPCSNIVPAVPNANAWHVSILLRLQIPFTEGKTIVAVAVITLDRLSDHRTKIGIEVNLALTDTWRPVCNQRRGCVENTPSDTGVVFRRCTRHHCPLGTVACCALFLLTCAVLFDDAIITLVGLCLSRSCAPRQ